MAAAGWELTGGSSAIRTILRKGEQASIAGFFRKEGSIRNPEHNR